MIPLLAVSLVQLADLVTWIPAIVRYPGGELGPAGHLEIQTAIAGKAIGIAVMVVGLGVFELRQRKYPRLYWWRFWLAVLFVCWGAAGVMTNIVNG